MAKQPEVHFRIVRKKGNDKSTPTSKGKKQIIEKESSYMIYLQFCYNGNRLFYAVGQSINGGDWNEKKERVKNNNATTVDGKFSLNDLLDNLKKVCEKTYHEALQNGIPQPKILATALDTLQHKNNDTSPATKATLFTLAERFISGEIKNKGKDKSKSSLQNYAAVTKHLKQYAAAKKCVVDFETIDLDFFYSYVDYLKKKINLSHNSIAKDISIIKVFMGEAVDLGYTDNMKFKHKKFSHPEIETDHIYLKEAELHHLYKFDLSSNKRLEQVRDLFIFGAWVGLRISDYGNIKPENIVSIDGEMFIDITTKKTKERVIIPCNPVVLEIFEKYKHNANRLPNTISDQRFNEYIKEACMLAGMDEAGRLISKPNMKLWECVSSHSCRRSFATNYYLQGFPTIDLMKITTHKTEKSFMKYIRTDKLDTAKRLAAHNRINWSKKILKIA